MLLYVVTRSGRSPGITSDMNEGGPPGRSPCFTSVPAEDAVGRADGPALNQDRPLGQPAPPAIAVYVGGPLLATPEAVIRDLKPSGFTTVIAWTLHVNPAGDLAFNNEPLFTGGRYVGPPGWPAQLAGLKTGGQANRLLCSVGSAGAGDFHHIRALLDAPGRPLQAQFAALRRAIPAVDGIDLDDEDLMDQPTTVAFCRMLGGLGFEVTFCPYNRPGFWLDCLQALHGQAPGLVTAFHLQCYAGGAWNEPGTWIRRIADRMGPAFDATAMVQPGLWCRHGGGCQAGDAPADMADRFRAWKADGVRGGFVWLYDDLLACPGFPAPDYARALREGLD